MAALIKVRVPAMVISALEAELHTIHFAFHITTEHTLQLVAQETLPPAAVIVSSHRHL